MPGSVHRTEPGFSVQKRKTVEHFRDASNSTGNMISTEKPRRTRVGCGGAFVLLLYFMRRETVLVLIEFPYLS